jgi:hypothetical protein
MSIFGALRRFSRPYPSTLTNRDRVGSFSSDILEPPDAVAFPTSRLSGVRQDFLSKIKKRWADMSFRDFLNLVVVAALIALSAALHTPYSESLAAGLTIMSH